MTKSEGSPDFGWCKERGRRRASGVRRLESGGGWHRHCSGAIRDIMRINTMTLVRIVVSGVLPLMLCTRAAWQAPFLVVPPADWEARPPLHARPDLASSPYGYSPAQVRHAYGLDQIAGGGAGQIIAIVDAYGSSTIQNDLNVFSDRYGLPRTTVQLLYPQGKPRRSNSGWALETSLDVEWAHAVAPGATI